MNHETDISDTELGCIDRIVTGQSGADDFATLARLAARDEHVWSRINDAVRCDRVLRDAVDRLGTRAECISLPAIKGGDHHKRERTFRVTAWSGWAAAALIVLATLPALLSRSNASSDSAQLPVFTSEAASPDEAYANYLTAGRASGRIVEEMPVVTVDWRQIDGQPGYEVFYVRRIIERAVIDDLDIIKLASDEHGRPVAVPGDEQSLRPSRSSL